MLQPLLFSNPQHVEWASPHPVLAFRPHENDDSGHQNTQVFWKRSPDWKFLKTPGCRFREEGPKRRFRKWWGHTSYCANSVRFAIVLCSCGWSKTIWIKRTEEKTLRYQKNPDTCGQGPSSTLNMTRYSIQQFWNNSCNICWSDQMLW